MNEALSLVLKLPCEQVRNVLAFLELISWWRGMHSEETKSVDPTSEINGSIRKTELRNVTENN